MHEPAPDLILESSGYRYGTIDQSDLAKILRDTRSPTIDGSGYCEANQTLSLIIPVLADAFPEARYIWLIRNGLDVVASAYQKQWYSGHSENHDRYEDCPPLEKMWIDGRIQGARCGDMSTDEWQKLDRFGRCCWYWNYVNRTVEQNLKRHCLDRFILIRLEEIDKDFSNLVEWMGFGQHMLPSINQSNIAKRIPYHWTDWSDEHRKIFELWCGDLMDRIYPDWRVYTDEKAKIFLVPAMNGLRRKVEDLSAEVEKHRMRVKEQGEKLQRLSEEAKRYRSKLEETIDQVKRLVAEKNGLESALMALKNSLSWKMTKPLRNAKDLLKKKRAV